MNWSKKDFKVDSITNGNQVFNRAHNTVDPKTFTYGTDHSVVHAGMTSQLR